MSVGVNQARPSYVGGVVKAGDNSRGEGIVETRVEALMENLAVAVMQADNLAAESRDYEVLAETLAYALDLAELGLSAESSTFDLSETPKPK